MLRYEGFMQQVALDKYVFMRDAYLQHRNFLIERNKQGDQNLDKNKVENVAAGKQEVHTEVETKPFVNI